MRKTKKKKKRGQRKEKKKETVANGKPLVELTLW